MDEFPATYWRPSRLGWSSDARMELREQARQLATSGSTLFIRRLNGLDQVPLSSICQEHHLGGHADLAWAMNPVDVVREGPPGACPEGSAGRGRAEVERDVRRLRHWLHPGVPLSRHPRSPRRREIVEVSMLVLLRPRGGGLDALGQKAR